MACQECSRLLVLYRDSVEAYRDAVESLSGTVDDGFVRALDLVKRRWLELRDAGDAMSRHSEECHSVTVVAAAADC
jgi:hypothetical protein